MSAHGRSKALTPERDEREGCLMSPALDVCEVPLGGVQLIEASAGTGKTYNICALVLRLLLERGLEVSQLLVVTFTKAATAELRERIRTRLVEALALLRADEAEPLAGDPFLRRLLEAIEARGVSREQMRQRLDLAQRCFDEAAVLTIHSYCQQALGDAPFTARMPMALDLIQDDAALIAEVVHDFWRRHLSGPEVDPALAAALDALGDTPTRHLRLLQRRLQRPLAALRWPDEVDAVAAPEALSRHPTVAALIAAHDEACTRWRRERETVIARLRAAQPGLHATLYGGTKLDDAIDAWDRFVVDDGAAAAVGQAVRKRPPSDALPRLGSALLAAKAKKGQNPPAHAFFDAAQALLDLLKPAAAVLRAARLRLLRQLLEEGPPEVRARKRERRVLAFDDMLYNLHARLTGPGGAALVDALRRRFPAALIDEFQDTDPLQWSIFETLYGEPAGDGRFRQAAGEGRFRQAAGEGPLQPPAGDGRFEPPAGHGRQGLPLFLVGDPKQAIYSFRQADLPTYLRARAQARATWTLGENQRSSPALIAALNTLFTRHPRAFVREGLDYPRVAAGAKPRAVFVDRSATPRAALDLWRLPGGGPGDADAPAGPLGKAAAKALAATTTAREIARLLGAARAGQVTLDGRPLGAGDIAVLVRSHREGRQMRLALAAVGVGSVELSQASVLASAEAQALAWVLAAVAEPGRERPLRAALATELMGWDAARLAALAEDEAALLALVGRFDGYRHDWLRHGVGTMLRRWMRGEQVAARLLAQPEGERRLTNLLHLAETLQQAEAEHATPEALRRWYDAARQQPGADEATQLRLESDRHLVQIVTVHKSKGLEYPLVYVPFLFDGSLPADAGDDVQLVREPDGTAVLDFRRDGDAGYDAAAVQREARLDAAAERLRLVYVALTRAVHRCTLVVGPYLQAVGRSRHDTESRQSVLNWLVAAPQDDDGEDAEAAAEAWFRRRQPTPPDTAALDAAWQACAAAACAAAPTAAPTAGPAEPPAAAFGPMPMLPPQRLVPDEGDAAAWRALPPPRSLPAPWRIGSYSHLLHGATQDAAAQDHDAQAEAEASITDAPTAGASVAIEAGGEDPLEAATDDDLLDYPRGAAAGDSLHALLERIDFGDPSGWPAAIEAVLQQHPLSVPGLDPAATRTRLRAMLQRWLGELMDTPIVLPGAADGAHDGVREGAKDGPGAAGAPKTLRLSQLAKRRCRVEWPFHLPTAALSSEALTRLLAAHGVALPRLSFATLQGYLKGYVDLVFEHEGRVYLLDWKSNHLGRRPADYAQAGLDAAMAAHGYALQQLLYAVALRRALAAGADGGEARYGGALYLFVRGVRPGWRQPDGRPCGVWSEAPRLALLDELDALLRGVQDPALLRGVQDPALLRVEPKEALR